MASASALHRIAHTAGLLRIDLHSRRDEQDADDGKHQATRDEP